jgi:hypothetical protein
MTKLDKIFRAKTLIWKTLSSPRTIAFLKLGAAVVGVVHAIDELRETPKSKQQIGFRFGNEED